MNNDSINAIKILIAGVEKHIELLNIENRENLKDYRLQDFIEIEDRIKVCPRCGKRFIPLYVNKDRQLYCGDDCRYNSTQDTRKEYKQDIRYHKIDSLRKLVYEHKYRARRDSKPLSESRSVKYEYILSQLKPLVRKRHTLSNYEFNKQLDELYKIYRSVSKQ
jgi:ribosomal protein S27AE